MSNEIVDNTLKSLRGVLFRELSDLRNGDSHEKQSMAVAKLAHQVVETYKVEIDAVRCANELKDKNLSYASNLIAIQTEDTKNEEH